MDTTPSAAPFWDEFATATQIELATILQIKIPEVLRAIRFVEHRTGYASQISRSMMVDVLGHLSVLAAGAGELSPKQQIALLTKMDQHLSRALIEHPAEVVRVRLEEVSRSWSLYQSEVMPIRGRDDALPGVPPHSAMEELRERIGGLLDAAREANPVERSWEETMAIAADMTEAAHVAARLEDQLLQAIGTCRVDADSRPSEPPIEPLIADVNDADESKAAANRDTVLSDNAPDRAVLAPRETVFLSGEPNDSTNSDVTLIQKFDVLLAHTSGDRSSVRQMARHLRFLGLEPWLDEEQIAPGRWVQDALQDAIRECFSAAIIIGPGGLGRWQEVETRALLEECVERDVPVIPVLLPGGAIPARMLFLRQLNWVEFHDNLNDQGALNRLAWGVRAAAGAIPSGPPPLR